ncbi:RES family NAD+ phosphorylase [Pseudorhodobacter sp.]|uniref:RES family NAD+ phosphorylase n=1 Tax=Pseudorhodobacter sp. TaxID=1934400 RepID=UPI0026493DE4|nr:RES family NAD+ phosphorylase [Pseudorhodobacter sp.]MDN5787335.1 RES family NAD+ phosphorylase [Pseudorhodobacter sp.]
MPRVPPFEGTLAPYARVLWRIIEGQYRSSTIRIVDTFAEHDLLEAMLEDSKPPVPEECRHLDYQFWSPFRYGCYPKDSRFRRKGRTPGVWYGSEAPLTALCEMIWGTLRFFGASTATPLPRKAIEYSAVAADIKVPLMLDLTEAPWRGAGDWMAPLDYSDCLMLADNLRAAGGEAIRYASVRHPDHAPNVAVLTCRGFADPHPVALQTWHVQYAQTLVRASCETDHARYSFAVKETKLYFD